MEGSRNASLNCCLFKGTKNISEPCIRSQSIFDDSINLLFVSPCKAPFYISIYCATLNSVATRVFSFLSISLLVLLSD